MTTYFENIMMKNEQNIDQIIQYYSLSLVMNKIATFKALIGDITNIFIKNFNNINLLLTFQNIKC
jgi:hypothetical protein